MNEKITYKNLIESDIEELTPIMKASFDADTRMHTDLEEDGPSGYDNGKLLCFLMNLEDSESKVIYYNDEMIGEYTIIRKNDIYTLDMLFISPDYESKGLGTRVLNDIEKSYDGVKTWIVETPSYSKRNHYFYEKAGFRRIREKIYDDGSKSLIFSKHKKKYKPEIKNYLEKRDYEKIIDSCKN